MSLYGLGNQTPIHRIHHQSLRIGVGPLDWDLMDGLSRWLRPDFGHSLIVNIEDSDGTFAARSVGEARDDVRSRGSSVREADLSFSKDGLAVDIRYQNSQTEVAARGVDENSVYGLIARLRQAAERGLIPGAAREGDLVTFDQVETRGPAPAARIEEGFWRRLLQRPNVWILEIGAAVIAALVIWLLVGQLQ
jgi:hypothetical protein